MAVYHIDTSAAIDGDGTESSPFNTTAGRTWGTGNRWRFKCDTTIREYMNLTGTVSNLVIEPYGSGAKPVFDCEGVRATALNTNSKDAITVTGLRFVNQDSSSSGALSITGSTGSRTAQDCEFENCRLAIGISSSVKNIIRRMRIDVGNTNTKSTAYGVRVYGALSADNVLEDLEIFSTAGLTYGTGIEIAAGTTTTVRRSRITAYSCDGILARGGSTGHLIESVLIAGDMKDLLAFEDSSSNTVRNVTLWQTGAIGSTYPCVKLGNDFGAGSPSDNNDFQNCLMYSGGEIPFVISNGGASNTVDYCHILREGSTLLMRNDIFGEAANQFLSLAQMQSAGYNANGATGAPGVSSVYIPLAGSPLLNGGADLGYLRDIRGHQSRKHIGAYGAARLRSA